MRWLVVVCGVGLMSGLGAWGQASTAATRCDGLKSLKLDGATVTSTSVVAAGSAVEGAKLSPESVAGLKAFCRVRLTDQPSADSLTQVEVWLPVDGWNGRYRGVGNGGFAGEIYYDQMAGAMSDGSATSGTDAGHEGVTGTFALGHPEKVKDFGWRAIHDTAVEAKALIAAFYGKPQSHAYFTACSDGGREALMEAQRFPADYDGILAGAPAYNWTALVSSGAVDVRALNVSAASYLPAKKIPAIATAVRNTCDPQDGVKDGVLNDPRACRFNPEAMACKQGDAEDCLMPEQVATLKTIYSAKVDAQGKKVFPGYLPGAEDAKGGWVGWMVGNAPGDQTAMLFFSMGYFSDFVHQQADWSLQSFDFDKDYKLANETTAKDLNATDPNLKPFVSRGGKLIVYHGWNDPAIPALSSVEYWDALHAAMSAKDVEGSVKLYMVPGMLHCDGGPGATSFGQDGVRGDAEHDVFAALEQWVEAGKAPARLTATGNGMTRPLCAYPAEAKYLGGDVKDAKSFGCVVAGR